MCHAFPLRSNARHVETNGKYWATELVAGKDVKIEVEAIFSGTSQRPDAFEVSFWIDGTKTERTFINE